VMKYVHGETLETIIDKLAAGDPDYHARYGIERRVEIMMGILEAIAYAHAKKIIHRDIKPANIMVGPYGEVMVMDWGLAREVNGPERVATPDLLGAGHGASAPASSPDASGSKKLFQTRVGTLLGTPAYMSPEQARGEALDERSDIYSLCVMFYELIALHHPHASETTLDGLLDAVKNKQPAIALMHSSAIQGRVPADISWFIEAGLEKDKAKRYQSIEEMIVRLRNRAAGDIPIQCPFTFTMRATMWARRAIARSPFVVFPALAIGTLATIGFAVFGVAQLVVR
jgi:serine/threonine protein kinase